MSVETVTVTNVIDLDSRRPHVTEWMRCTDCFYEHITVRPADAVRVWWECPKCGEMACKAIDKPLS